MAEARRRTTAPEENGAALASENTSPVAPGNSYAPPPHEPPVEFQNAAVFSVEAVREGTITLGQRIAEVASWGWGLLLTVNWGLLWAKLKLWGWQLLTKPALALGYLLVTSEGIRMAAPSIAVPLFEIGDEVADFAHVCSLGMLLATWYLGGRMLRFYLRPQIPINGRYDSSNHSRLIAFGGMAVLLIDAYLFHSAVVQMTWSGGGASLTSLIVTVMWIGILMFVNLVTVDLKDAVEAQESGELS